MQFTHAWFRSKNKTYKTQEQYANLKYLKKEEKNFNCN